MEKVFIFGHKSPDTDSICASLVHERLDKRNGWNDTEAIDSERKSKVGTGDRAEKIRTYNYPQNRVTDHRIGLTIQQLDRIIEGKLDDIITALINEDQRLKLEGQK